MYYLYIVSSMTIPEKFKEAISVHSFDKKPWKKRLESEICFDKGKVTMLFDVECLVFHSIHCGPHDE